jgi:hypothetical protein
MLEAFSSSPTTGNRSDHDQLQGPAASTDHRWTWFIALLLCTAAPLLQRRRPTYALRVRRGLLVGVVLVLLDLLLTSSDVRSCSPAWLLGWLLACASMRAPDCIVGGQSVPVPDPSEDGDDVRPGSSPPKLRLLPRNWAPQRVRLPGLQGCRHGLVSRARRWVPRHRLVAVRSLGLGRQSKAVLKSGRQSSTNS